MALKFASMSGFGVFFLEPAPQQLQKLPSVGSGEGLACGGRLFSGPRDHAKELHHGARATFLCQLSTACTADCGCGNWLSEGTASFTGADGDWDGRRRGGANPRSRQQVPLGALWIWNRV